MKLPKMRSIPSIVTATAIVACGVWGLEQIVCSTHAADGPKSSEALMAHMRKKLEASSQVLEGLVTENAQLIQTGANALGEISRSEKWQIIGDADYRAYSTDFRANVKKLAEAAEKGNFDNVALQWFDTTKSCIECHQHVRRFRIQLK